MGVFVFEDNLLYIENSSDFCLYKEDTPLLLTHGYLDFISLELDEEMYSGLKRLNKTVEFARYWKEAHVL
jgi:dipeptidyl aminopeptidase/acylaminoacyl peptidase